MNKEQSADDPSVDLTCVKNMFNSTISMSYPDVVIACIEHKVSLEAFRAIEQQAEARGQYEGLSPGVDYRLTTAN